MQSAASVVADVVVVGSGPAGVMAAQALVEQGLSVHLVHMGYDDDQYRSTIPDKSFADIRGTDPDQARYFLGTALEGVPRGGVKIGSQLTPPRQFTTRNTDAYLPTDGASFVPMQSLALGGLGAAWGAAAYTYSAAELARMGLPSDLSKEYQAVADRIGVSAANTDDTSAACTGGLERHQPPLAIDANATALLTAYQRQTAAGHKGRLAMGRMPLAILSQDLGNRRANPLHDMDFWSDVRRSIYRPRYTMEQLQQGPRFAVTSGVLVTRFVEHPQAVEVHGHRPDDGGATVTVAGKRLVLCAGALNSARLVLASREQAGLAVPLLCNPYTYMPCIQLRRLGQAAPEARHSMAQLAGIFTPDDAPDELVSLQLYSYRSLLAFKLVKEIPLHPWAGLQVVRLLMNSLVIVGVHHHDAPQPNNWLAVQAPQRSGEVWPLQLAYQGSEALETVRARREWAILKELRKLGCYGGARLRPGNASSIHYAGTIPQLPPGADDRHGTTPDGRLIGSRRVFVADSAGWNWLPAKGLTLTIMANARRVAQAAAADLRGDHA